MATEIDAEDPGVDQQMLRKLYKQSASARAIFDHFASRQRDWGETTVDRIQANVEKAGTVLSRAEVVTVLRLLDECGCGRFVIGRRGKPSRFDWRVSLVAVGQLAAGNPVPQAELELPPEPEREDDTCEMVNHSYLLRAGLGPVTLRLPVDITVTEAARLAGFIRTLPLDQQL
jgi:hypothetical protein